MKDNLYIDVMPYVYADDRKYKFLRYSVAETFYQLPYNEMNKAIAIGSKFVVEDKQIGSIKSTFYTNAFVFYYKIIDRNSNWFGIIYVEKIEINVERRI